jgi:Kef-type K+ transport system membrane component KefB
MPEHQIILVIFIIFSGAAILATFALFTRQSILVAYMVLGIVLGPWGLKLVNNASTVRDVGEIGIIFLLFLLGLHLPPQKLWQMLKKVSWVGFMSSLIFAAIGFFIMWCFKFSIIECLVVGAAVMFSSTIIGIKLLPTTVLHHQHTGEVMISVLLLQDLIAIIVLVLLHALAASSKIYIKIGLVAVAFLVLFFLAYLIERFLLFQLLKKFNRIKECPLLGAWHWRN